MERKRYRINMNEYCTSTIQQDNGLKGPSFDELSWTASAGQSEADPNTPQKPTNQTRGSGLQPSLVRSDQRNLPQGRLNSNQVKKEPKFRTRTCSMKSGKEVQYSGGKQKIISKGSEFIAFFQNLEKQTNLFCTAPRSLTRSLTLLSRGLLQRAFHARY